MSLNVELDERTSVVVQELATSEKRSASFTHQLELLLRLTNAIDRLRQNEEHWRLFNMVNR